MADIIPLTPIFADRTRITTYWRCPRRRYWAFEYAGRGISHRRHSYILDYGILYHEGVASLLLGTGLEETIVAMRERLTKSLKSGSDRATLDEAKATEQLAILEGQLRGFVRIYLPIITERYTIVKVEGEILHRFGAVELGTKPDLLLERKSDSTLWYFEWKTSGSMKPKWFRQWHRAVQLHAGARGVAATLGRELHGIEVHAAYKGYEKYGRQESIFAYGYAPRSGVDERGLMYTYVPGLMKYPVWEHTDVKTWVEGMPMDTLARQFGTTGPVFLQQSQCEMWERQTSIKEVEIRNAREAIKAALAAADQQAAQDLLDQHFPQYFDQCDNAYGSACSYNDACWVDHVSKDPIRSGLYVWRQPHHTTDPDYEGEVDND